MQKSEEEMRAWVKLFISEMQRIETFYLKMYEEYKNEYDTLNKRYYQKNQEHYEPEFNNAV